MNLAPRTRCLSGRHSAAPRTAPGREIGVFPLPRWSAGDSGVEGTHPPSHGSCASRETDGHVRLCKGVEIQETLHAATFSCLLPCLSGNCEVHHLPEKGKVGTHVYNAWKYYNHTTHVQTSAPCSLTSVCIHVPRHGPHMHARTHEHTFYTLHTCMKIHAHCTHI